MSWIEAQLARAKAQEQVAVTGKIGGVTVPAEHQLTPTAVPMKQYGGGVKWTPAEIPKAVEAYKQLYPQWTGEGTKSTTTISYSQSSPTTLVQPQQPTQIPWWIWLVGGGVCLMVLVGLTSKKR